MSEIDDIKNKVNIADYIGRTVKLKRAGRNFKGLCPFHNEKTPSFMVSPDRNTWHCFGCGKGGSIFDFVMEYEHVDFAEALEDMAELAGVTLTRSAPATGESKQRAVLYEINHLASEYYHYLLTKHDLGETARLYLKHRGISEKAVATFMLGYSPKNWEALYRFLRKKGYTDELMELAGLIIRRQDTGNRKPGFYDRFRGRVMFTLKDHRGNVVGFAGRVLEKDVKDAKYINTPETPVYSKSHVLYGLDVTKAAIQKSGEAILMEGELDVISSYQAGIANAVAIKGSALTEGHVHLIKRFAERVIFALDSDLAGDAAARRGIEIADRAGLDMRVSTMPSGKDPDDAAREDPVAFKKALAAATPIYDYFLASALKRFDVTSSWGKKKIADELVPTIAKIDNSIVQGHYINLLAQALRVSETVVTESIKKAQRLQYVVPQRDKKDALVKTQSRREKLELQLLAFLLQGKTQEWFEEFAGLISPSDISYPAVAALIERLDAFLAQHPVFLMKDFADMVPPELTPVLEEALLTDFSDSIDNEELAAREWTETLSEYHKLLLRTQIQTQTKYLAEQEQAGASEAQLSKIQQEITRLSLAYKQLEK